jgi:hypothetical protein
MIEFLEHQPPVSSAALATAEKRLAELGHHIPPSYRAFLAEHNGGEPVRAVFSFQQDNKDQSDSVKVFFGIAPSPDGDLVDAAESVSGRVPAEVLPIGEDSFGNLICLDGREGRDGPVLFWDHEHEGEPPDEANLYEIAPDLQTFLNSLYEDPDPPVVPQQQTGWRRLFGRRT